MFIKALLINSPKVQCLSTAVMGKRTVAHSHNGVLLDKNKEWTTDKHNPMDESHRHNAELQKSDWKEYIQYSSICMKSENRRKKVLAEHADSYFRVLEITSYLEHGGSSVGVHRHGSSYGCTFGIWCFMEVYPSLEV